jgi:CO dehydrogenase/acetyl-CoA synthase alpha subunit
MKYQIYKQQLEKVNTDYKTHVANQKELTVMMKDYIVTEINKLKKKEVWHKCHSRKPIFFGVKFYFGKYLCPLNFA